MTSEPTIICPKCETEIRLTESLAAPTVERTSIYDGMCRSRANTALVEVVGAKARDTHL